MVTCKKSFYVLPASSQIMIWRLLINYESSAYSLGLFLIRFYNLNPPIYIHLQPSQNCLTFVHYNCVTACSSVPQRCSVQNLLLTLRFLHLLFRQVPQSLFLPCGQTRPWHTVQMLSPESLPMATGHQPYDSNILTSYWLRTVDLAGLLPPSGFNL